MTDDTFQKLTAARDWCRLELDACVDFWLAHGMDPRERRRVHLPRPHGRGVLHRQERVDAGALRLDVRAPCAACTASAPNGWRPRRAAWTSLEERCINREAGGRLYFTVTAEGKPLRQRRYCFSEGFYAIANAEYYGLTGEVEHLERARWAYEMIYNLNNGLIEDPTGLGPKTIAETRSGYALGDPMIFLNIIGIMRRVDPANAEEYDRHARECTDRIVNWHYRPELGCTLESVNAQGQPGARVHGRTRGEPGPRRRAQLVHDGRGQLPRRQGAAPHGRADLPPGHRGRAGTTSTTACCTSSTRWASRRKPTSTT